MSEENVEALRRAAAAANNKDPSILDALLDREVVWEATMQAPGLSGTYRGIDKVRGFFARWAGAWEDWDWSHPEMVAVGDKVVARMHLWARGRGSGIEIENDVWQVWTFRDGKVTHYADFESRELALEAARRSE